jgi:acyl-CoA reductase-like NAD-dependent aldehyde dehydrogenase
MSTDVVLVAQSVDQRFRNLLHQRLSNGAQQVTNVINSKSKSRIDVLVKNAEDGGAAIKMVEASSHGSATIIEDITSSMAFWSQESFGPLLGLRSFANEEEAVNMVNDSQYGLSGAIFSRNHLRALKLAKKLQTGAVHVNSSTVHDEACLPHGGRKESGWGRFGAFWAFDEFLQTKTVILHP